MKNKIDIEDIRNNADRTPLIIVNEISKLFNESMIRDSIDPIMKERTARLMLLYLSHNDGVSQQELVYVTQMKGSTVSASVKKLEEAEYVKRVPCEHDMRSVKVFITKKGKEVSEKTKLLLNGKDKAIMKGISERDIRTAKYVLEKMLDNLIEL